jgi:hypothetical protein
MYSMRHAQVCSCPPGTALPTPTHDRQMPVKIHNGLVSNLTTWCSWELSYQQVFSPCSRLTNGDKKIRFLSKMFNNNIIISLISYVVLLYCKLLYSSCSIALITRRSH